MLVMQYTLLQCTFYSMCGKRIQQGVCFQLATGLFKLLDIAQSHDAQSLYIHIHIHTYVYIYITNTLCHGSLKLKLCSNKGKERLKKSHNLQMKDLIKSNAATLKAYT